ncbi:zinc finger protein RFP-like isoform X3 [Varanus komodoensis]|uniref:zinc finger protein RFP-like isoform X3 n=1 Tax=Varanus komodoensis TaxID=61221 RepID=UPI001CF79273|nr:zinc finger protein RFP-like isoform X3 [Varanus komodoensis]
MSCMWQEVTVWCWKVNLDGVTWVAWASERGRAGLAFTGRKLPLTDLWKVKPLCAAAMADTPKSTIWALCEESTCPICLDYFRDPVIITECGHNFCRACLSQSGGNSDAQASCPQCRGTFQKSSLWPNRQLARIVEIARKSREEAVKGAEGKVQLCEKHWEPQKLFCKDHEAPICLVCDRAKEHKDHQVVPLEEASQEYQEQTKAEREEMVAQFRRLHQFLEEQEKYLLIQVDELQEEIGRKAEDHLARLSKELSSLEGIMREVEEKSRQPAAELLQDVRSTLQRSEKEPCEIPAAVPLELKRRIWYFSDRKPDLEGWRKQFPGVMSESKGI